MRVLWYGIPPWLPTGYASQAAIWCRRMAAAGHDVTIASFSGLTGMNMEWEKIPVLGNAPEIIAQPLILQRQLERLKPDVVFVHCDHRAIISPELFAPVKTVAFIASDGDRIGAGDAQFLQRSRAVPWAISRHMQRLLEDAGYDAPYVPHAIDCAAFAPPADRAALRAEVGLEPGQFAVGINARNIDPMRKALPEQIAAFARYHKRNPQARLFLHSINVEPSNSTTPTWLSEVVQSLGLKQPTVTISEQEQMYLEQFPQDALIKWYGAMDVVMNCSRAEGFGLAAVEAQACGTPVILADNSTGPELQGPGWLVPCDHDHWNAVHKCWYGKPLGKPMTEALAKAAAVTNVPSKRESARVFAQQFDIESVWPLFDKALAELSS